MSLTDFLKYNNCVSWLPFPHVRDKITNLDYTINGTATPYILVNGTKALYLNGASSISDLTFTLGSTFTISMWYNQTVTPPSSSASAYLFTAHNSNSTSSIKVRIDNSNILRFSATHSGTTYTVSSTALSNNEWYHIVCIGTPTALTLYVNGISINTVASVSLPTTTYSTKLIGNSATSSTTNTFTGYIKNFMVFNEHLTTKQIQKLYYYTYIS